MRAWFRLLPAESAIVLALVLLCGFFSIATIDEHTPVGEAGAKSVAARIGAAENRGKARVLIVAGTLPEDLVFAEALERRLQGGAIEVAAVVKGEPRDARAALVDLASREVTLDFIALTPAASAWLVFADLSHDFPALGEPRLVAPESHRWPNFLTSTNLLNIADQIAVIAIMAIGMTLVILTGGIDLSVGSLLAFAAVLATLLIREFAGAETAGVAGMVLAGAGTVAACGMIGGLNGLLVTGLRMPPFIVTLAAMLMTSGAAYLLSSGQSVHQVPESFTRLGRGAIVFGLPNAVVLMAALYLLAHLFMTRTVLGRHLYAVGGNRAAARLSGIPVDRILRFAYVMSAALAGLGGVVMASQLKSGSPTYGNLYELYVIAAVVVGGTSLKGGRGTMIGTLLGAFLIAVIQNGMNLVGVESYTQKVVLGAVILGAVGVDCLRRGRGAEE